MLVADVELQILNFDSSFRTNIGLLEWTTEDRPLDIQSTEKTTFL
jgi:hypothetical protein